MGRVVEKDVAGEGVKRAVGDDAIDPLPPDAAHPAPTPETGDLPEGAERFRAFRYFIGYVAEAPKGRIYGNTILNLPAPIQRNAHLAQIEKTISENLKELGAVKGVRVIGQRIPAIITAVNFLGSFEVVAYRGTEVAGAEEAVNDSASEAVAGGDADAVKES